MADAVMRIIMEAVGADQLDGAAAGLERLDTSFEKLEGDLNGSAAAWDQFIENTSEASQRLNELNATVDHSSQSWGNWISQNQNAIQAQQAHAKTMEELKGVAGEVEATLGAAAVAIGVVTAAATAGAAAVLYFGDSFAKANIAIAESASMAGTTAAKFSEMGAAAEASAVGGDHLQQGLAMLAMHMKMALVDGQGLPPAFGRIGISLDQIKGSGVTTSQVLELIADKFQGLTDGAQKTALAQELMGRGGAALIPILNEGSAALETQMHRADALGLTVTDADVKISRAFESTKAQTEQLGEAFLNVFERGMMPAITTLAQTVEGQLQNAWDAFTGSMGGVQGATQTATTVFDGLGGAVTTVADVALPALKIGLDVGIAVIGGAVIGVLKLAEAFDTVAAAVDRFIAALPGTKGVDDLLKSADKYDQMAKSADDAAAATRRFGDGLMAGVSALGQHTIATHDNNSALNENTSATSVNTDKIEKNHKAKDDAAKAARELAKEERELAQIHKEMQADRVKADEISVDTKSKAAAFAVKFGAEQAASHESPEQAAVDKANAAVYAATIEGKAGVDKAQVKLDNADETHRASAEAQLNAAKEQANEKFMEATLKYNEAADKLSAATDKLNESSQAKIDRENAKGEAQGQADIDRMRGYKSPFDDKGNLVNPGGFSAGTGIDGVPGSGSGDTVPAMLEPGEIVLNQAQSEIYRAAARGEGDGKIQATPEQWKALMKMMGGGGFRGYSSGTGLGGAGSSDYHSATNGWQIVGGRIMVAGADGTWNDAGMAPAWAGGAMGGGVKTGEASKSLAQQNADQSAAQARADAARGRAPSFGGTGGSSDVGHSGMAGQGSHIGGSSDGADHMGFARAARNPAADAAHMKAYEAQWAKDHAPKQEPSWVSQVEEAGARHDAMKRADVLLGGYRAQEANTEQAINAREEEVKQIQAGGGSFANKQARDLQIARDESAIKDAQRQLGWEQSNAARAAGGGGSAGPSASSMGDAFHSRPTNISSSSADSIGKAIVRHLGPMLGGGGGGGGLSLSDIQNAMNYNQLSDTSRGVSPP